MKAQTDRLVPWAEDGQIEIAHIEKVGRTADEAVDMGFHLAGYLSGVIRAAFVPGSYRVVYAAGPKSQMHGFMTEMTAPGWSLMETVILTKDTDGEMSTEMISQPPSIHDGRGR